MKTIKKLCALLLALLLTMSLAACGADDSGSDGNDPAAKKEFSVGELSGDTYTNEYFGFAATLDGWTFLSKDQLSQLTEQVADLLDDEEIAKVYAAGKVVMEMYAGNGAGGTVNVTVENLGDANGAKYTESSYVDATVSVLPDKMTNAGYTDVSVNKTDVTLAGANHSGISVVATSNGVTVYETLVCVKVGNYVCTVTTATAETDTTAEILGLFEAL